MDTAVPAQIVIYSKRIYAILLGKQNSFCPARDFQLQNNYPAKTVLFFFGVLNNFDGILRFGRNSDVHGEFGIGFRS